MAYEQGGVVGPSKKQALIEALQGGSMGPGTAPDMPMPNLMAAFGGGTVGPGTAPASAPPMQADSPAPSPFAFNQSNVSGILHQYDHTPAGLQKAFGEHPELSGVSKIGGSKGDKILDPTTGRYIDVIQAAGEGGRNWQWLDDAGGASPSGGMAPMPRPGGANPLASMLGSGGDAQANIQQALAQFQQPGLLQQLIAALGGGQ